MIVPRETRVELCSRCRINPPLPTQRYCKPCRADYMRAWRLSKRKLPIPPNVKQGDIITYEVGERGRIVLVSVENRA